MGFLVSNFEQASMGGGSYLLPERLIVRVTGSDRLRYLNGQVTNDLRRLVHGEAMRGCLLSPKGKLSAVIWITLEEEAFVLEAPLELSKELLERLERYLIADDVALEVLPSEATIHVFGEWVNNSVIQKVPGTLISRFGLFGKDIKLSALPEGFLTQHEPWSKEMVESFRIEQGVPQWEKELTTDCLPPEAHLERNAIDYNKGCYVGQEVISRLRSVGHVNRLLVGFSSVKKGEELKAGMKIFSLENSEKAIGFITSAIKHPQEGTYIALGYVTRNYAASQQHLCALEEVSGNKIEILVKVF